MGRVFSSAKPEYLIEMTPPELRHSGATTREAMPGWDLGSVVMGSPGDPDAPAVSILRMAPHGVLPRHAHQCHRVEVVVDGSIITPDGEVLRAGSVMISGPGEFYGPNTAGPDGSVSVEIFSTIKGMLPESDPDEDPDSYSVRTIARVRAVAARLQQERPGYG